MANNHNSKQVIPTQKPQVVPTPAALVVAAPVAPMNPEEQTQTPSPAAIEETTQQPAPVAQASATTLIPAQASGAVVSTASDKVGAVVSKETVAEVKVQKAAVSTPSIFTEEAQSLVDQIVKSGNGAAINVLEGIKSYMIAMKPGKIMNSVDGARHQALLFRTIQSAINGVEQDFQLLFATILKIMDDNSEGVFGGRFLFRFTENLALNADDRQGFLRILNLMTTAAAVSSRKEVMKQIDFPRSLQFSLTDDGRQRVLSFFGK